MRFFQELVTITGVLAVVMLATAVVLPARLKALTRRMGIEGVLASHRFLGLCATLMVLVHLMCVLVADPRALALLDVLSAPVRAVAATIATGSLLGLVIAAQSRARQNYEHWRWTHVVLAVIALIGSTLHVILIGELVLDPLAGPFLVAVAVAVAGSVIYRWIVAPSKRTAEFIVARVRAEAPGVSTVVLRPRAGRHAALKFEPGQFAWMRLERAPLAEEHPFTIASAAQDGIAPEFTIRHSGDWTTGPLARLRPGARVWLDGPHGAFTPKETAFGFVMISAGVGITPMMSMLRTFARAGDRRPMYLFLADRPDELLFRAELSEMEHHLDLHRVEFRRVRITAELLARHLPPTFLQLEYYICGGNRLIGDARRAIEDLHVPESRIHTEMFSE